MPADTGSPLDIPSSKGMNAPYGSANHHTPSKQHIETAPSNKGTGEGATGSGSASSSRRTVIHSVLLFCISVGTLYAFYDIGRSSNPVAVLVWWYGWITAASTGLGVLPFLCRSGNLNRTFIGFANGKNCNWRSPPLLRMLSLPLYLACLHASFDFLHPLDPFFSVAFIPSPPQLLLQL